MMSKSRQRVSQGRRQFMKRGVITGVGGVMVAGVSGTVAASHVAGEMEEKQAETGYRLTQHVLDYYRSAAD